VFSEAPSQAVTGKNAQIARQPEKPLLESAHDAPGTDGFTTEGADSLPLTTSPSAPLLPLGENEAFLVPPLLSGYARV
jgi:hypothetical protein